MKEQEKGRILPITSKVRLFQRVKYPESPEVEVAEEEAIYWEPDHLHLYYEDMKGKEDYWMVQKGTPSNEIPAYYPEDNLLMSNYWFDRFIKMDEDSLIFFNKGEFKKISERIIKVEEDISLIKKDDSVAAEALREEIVQMKVFKKKIISWLSDQNVDITKIIDVHQPIKDDKNHTYGISNIKWAGMRKMDKVRHMVELAREDEEYSSVKWRDRFRKEFPDSYSVELGRIRDEMPRGEKFAINGLAFYKG